MTLRFLIIFLSPVFFLNVCVDERVVGLMTLVCKSALCGAGSWPLRTALWVAWSGFSCSRSGGQLSCKRGLGRGIPGALVQLSAWRRSCSRNREAQASAAGVGVQPEGPSRSRVCCSPPGRSPCCRRPRCSPGSGSRLCSPDVLGSGPHRASDSRLPPRPPRPWGTDALFPRRGVQFLITAAC